MSVIIRLQNLPWSANAADIRTYFAGLSIPEGGVHIIGGEQGDAFIAFSTDEDARQAMLKDGGKLKEVKIKLFLSSRTEMLRIIEQARQQALKLHSLMATPAVPNTTAAPIMPMKPIITPPEVVEDANKNKEEEAAPKRDRRERSSSRGRDRTRKGGSSERSREREKSRGRSYRDRDRDRRRRDRSRSRSRSRSRDKYRSRRSRSRDRKKTSREKDGKDSRGKSKEMRTSERIDETADTKTNDTPAWNAQQFQNKLPDPPAIPQKLLQMHQNGKELSPSQPNVPFAETENRQFSFPNQMAPTPMVTPPFPPMPMRPREGWPPIGIPPLMDPNQMAMQRTALLPNPEMGMPGYPPNFPMNQTIFPTPNITPEQFEMWRMPSVTNFDSAVEESPVENTTDLCIEVRGLPLNASYIDVKKLFDGLNIPSDGIKMINDTHGNRTGIAYVKFNTASHKKSALNQNGKKVRSNVVEVLHLRDSIYKAAVDNFKPDKDVILNSVDMDIDVPEDKWPGSSHYTNSSVDRVSPRKMPSQPESIRKNNYLQTNVIFIKNLPRHFNEREIYEFFSEVGITPVQVNLIYDNMGQKVGDAYCYLQSPEDADKAAEISNSSYGRRIGPIIKVTREEADQRLGRMPQPWSSGPHNMPDQQPSGPGYMGKGGNHPENTLSKSYGEERYIDYNTESRYNDPIERGERHMSMRGSSNRGISRGMGRPPLLGKDPRSAQMNMTNSLMGGSSNGPGKMRMPMRNHRPDPSPYIDGDMLESFGRRGCVVALENIHFKADIDQIMDFFSGFSVDHEDVIRRFDDKGRPTGDARVALKSPSEAMRAVKELNYRHLRGRTVKVSLLT